MGFPLNSIQFEPSNEPQLYAEIFVNQSVRYQLYRLSIRVPLDSLSYKFRRKNIQLRIYTYT